MKDYTVQRIDPKEARPWILKKHYTQEPKGCILQNFGECGRGCSYYH